MAKLGIGGTSSSSYAINEHGNACAWGFNNYGQLGNNSTSNSSVPVTVDVSGVLSGKTITAVGGTFRHSIALGNDGTVYAWGRKNLGQLGDNSTTDSHVPVMVDVTGVLSGKTRTAVAAGSSHSLALASDGHVYSWGYNAYGQLGDNSTTNSSVPVTVVITNGDDFSLPVEITSFTAVCKGSAILLEWITESEVENLGFIIERSENDETWQEIAYYQDLPSLQGQGNSNTRSMYSFSDHNVVPGVCYDYRLADVSYQGQKAYYPLLQAFRPGDHSRSV